MKSRIHMSINIERNKSSDSHLVLLRDKYRRELDRKYKMGKTMELINFIIRHFSLLCDSLEMIDCLKGQDLWTGDPCVDKRDSRRAVLMFQSLAEATKDEKKAIKLYKVLQNLKRLDLATYENLFTRMPISLQEALAENRSPVTWSEFLLENVMTLRTTMNWSTMFCCILMQEGILSTHDEFEGCTRMEVFTKLVDIVVKKDHAVAFLSVLREKERHAFSELWKRMPLHLQAELR